MATTNDPGGVVDLTRGDEAGGDDITVVPGPGGPDDGGRRRGMWIWIVASAVLVAAVVVLLVATLSSSSDSKGTVQTSAQAPVATQPVTQTTAVAENATDTTVAAPTPTTSVTHTTNAPTHTNAPTPPHTIPAPPSNNTPPTTPPRPSGPSALTWSAPSSFSISKNGSTLNVRVTNNTSRPAYTPMPLDCLAYADHVCAEHTQTLQPGEVVTEHYILDASKFTSTPTAVYVGGYFKVLISA